MENYTGMHPTECELKALFEKEVGKRGTREANWEDYAGWTLPYLYPDEDVADGTEVQHDYQSLGAQAVNHLANKIVMTLFAPARPFFRLEITQDQENQLIEAGLTLEQIETLTGSVEKKAMRHMEKVALRTAVIMAIKNLVVLGNALLFFPPDGSKSQVYNLRDYCVKRDAGGKLMQIITQDRRVVATLPEDVREAASLNGHKAEDEVTLFTGITRQFDGKFIVKQELEGYLVIGKSAGVYPEEDLPWIALQWNGMRGEDYGVGLVEEYAGDFSVYSQLSRANLNLASLAADIKILVNPMGSTDVTTLNESESGTYVHGRAEDISYLQLEKMGDFQFVGQIMEQYARRIGSAFLLNTQVTRDAERVTALEIQLQANELESSLGGVYSRLAEDMQQPLARRLIGTVNTALKEIEPIILTGVESLSRNSEHEQMLMFLNDLTVINNIPESMQGELKLGDMARIMAVNRGIEHDKFMKTAAEKKKEQEAAQEAQAQQEQAMAAAKSVGEQAGQPAQPGAPI